MGSDFLIHFDEYVIQVACWMGIAFILGVSAFWPWWKTDLGWTIILETVGLTLLVLPTTVQMEFSINAQTLGWEWVASLSFLFVTVILPWRFWAIWKRQRYVRKDSE